MAVVATQYPKSVLHGIDMINDTLKVLLVTSSYTYDATHEYLSDISHEITGTGYSAGGATLTTPSDTYDVGTNAYIFTYDDAVWAAASFVTRAAVVYKSTGTAGTSVLIGYINFGSDQAIDDTTFTLHVNAAGLLRRQVIPAA